MHRMKAQKAFRLSESGVFVNPGEEFETRDPKHYEDSGMAFPVRDWKEPAVKPTVQNEAADAGPFVSVGGKTGETMSSPSSDQDQAPTRHHSKRLGGKTSK